MLWRVCGDLVLDFFCLSCVVKITLDRTGLRWRSRGHAPYIMNGYVVVWRMSQLLSLASLRLRKIQFHQSPPILVPVINISTIFAKSG